MKHYYNKYFFIGLILVFLGSLSGCYSAHEKAYYADMQNYITEDATVDNIIYNKKRNYIVLWLSGIDPSYQSCEFIIRDESASLAIENAILDKIKVGDTITYTSAPGYFGDGYFMPIIGLSIGNEEILDIDIGYQYLVNSY